MTNSPGCHTSGYHSQFSLLATFRCFHMDSKLLLRSCQDPLRLCCCGWWDCFSAELGCSLSGDSARLSSGDPGSQVLLGRGTGFLTVVMLGLAPDWC